MIGSDRIGYDRNSLADYLSVRFYLIIRCVSMRNVNGGRGGEGRKGERWIDIDIDIDLDLDLDIEWTRRLSGTNMEMEMEMGIEMKKKEKDRFEQTIKELPSSMNN
jgi:hypothetical protein